MPKNDELVIRISGLSGGISKQPAHIRHPTQVEAAVNAIFSVIDGMSKRPGTIFVAEVDDMTSTGYDLRIHVITRDNDEQYLVVFGIGTFFLTGQSNGDLVDVSDNNIVDTAGDKIIINRATDRIVDAAGDRIII